MAKHFGKKHDISTWIIHHDVSSKGNAWINLWFYNMKNERNLGYFILENQQIWSFSNKSMVSRKVRTCTQETLHLYVHPNLDFVKELITKYFITLSMMLAILRFIIWTRKQ